MPSGQVVGGFPSVQAGFVLSVHVGGFPAGIVLSLHAGFALSEHVGMLPSEHFAGPFSTFSVFKILNKINRKC